jgi:Cu(I)/Ag(I) efflux system membrane fusion protein/cobalt-zinc-cadmium efflux system membrane fusion protein
VLEGLQHGDRVVTSAQFLIDSETNLQAAMQSMVGHGHATGGEGGQPGGQAPATQAPAPAGLGITFSSRPDPPRTGENTFEVTVKDAQGQPVIDATVEVTFFMPAMPTMGMPAMQSRAALAQAGGGTIGDRRDLRRTVGCDGVREPRRPAAGHEGDRDSRAVTNLLRPDLEPFHD